MVETGSVKLLNAKCPPPHPQCYKGLKSCRNVNIVSMKFGSKKSQFSYQKISINSCLLSSDIRSEVIIMKNDCDDEYRNQLQ